MPEMPRLLLIDGNNMCHRVFWSTRSKQDMLKKQGMMEVGLSHKGRCVDVIYGFFRQLIALHKTYPDHFRIIAWDSGYARRLKESQAAVLTGLVPAAYKAGRPKRGEVTDNGVDMEPLYEQMEELRSRSLNFVSCLQVAVPGVEADDILNTYAKIYGANGWKSVVVSGDNDFYQVIDDNTMLYHLRDKSVWTKERFIMEYGFDPSLWVDAGAIMGETGKTKDNIFGIDGWGEKTACKYVQQYGNIQAIKEALEAKEKRGKKEQMFLDQQERLALAMSLKRMDIVPDVPKPRCPPRSEEDLNGYLGEWAFVSIMPEAWRLI